MVFVVLSSLALGGCATQYTAVRERAAFDFRCPENQVEAESGPGGLWVAAGCGQRANYVCSSPQGAISAAGQVSCTRER